MNLCNSCPEFEKIIVQLTNYPTFYVNGGRKILDQQLIWFQRRNISLHFPNLSAYSFEYGHRIIHFKHFVYLLKSKYGMWLRYTEFVYSGVIIYLSIKSSDIKLSTLTVIIFPSGTVVVRFKKGQTCCQKLLETIKKYFIDILEKEHNAICI